MAMNTTTTKTSSLQSGTATPKVSKVNRNKDGGLIVELADTDQQEDTATEIIGKLGYPQETKIDSAASVTTTLVLRYLPSMKISHGR